MTNTYAINTTRGKEFTVAEKMSDMGLKPIVPTRLAQTYVKEKRSYTWYDAAYIPKVLFSVIPAIYYPDVLKLKHVIGKPAPLTRADIHGSAAYQCEGGIPRPARVGLTGFLEAVEAEYADQSRSRDNADYVCAIVPGQALTVLSGPFEGFSAEFQKAVRDAATGFVKLRATVKVFGRDTPIEVDPTALG